MTFHSLSRREFAKAVAVGLVTALLLSAVIVPLFKLGISPFPKPLGLAFAETLLGGPLPLPVGLLFHVAYVTAWVVAYVWLCRDRLTILTAICLGLFLWVVVVAVFFPIVGWGFLGLGVSPKLIPASLVPHALFSIFLWGLCRVSFRTAATPSVGN